MRHLNEEPLSLCVFNLLELVSQRDSSISVTTKVFESFVASLCIFFRIYYIDSKYLLKPGSRFKETSFE